uniref:Uncharacterized protein n=1 Tax=viral metagenome TaxID=1070528 RepID=A0A6M3M8X2_9ZZZZ
MTFTYDVSKLTEELNRIRLEIGDTDSNRPLLDDEEIEQIISEIDSFNQQVAKCCRLVCSLFASEPSSVRIEGFSENYKEAHDHFMKMAEHYERLGGGGPWSGSHDDAFKEATEANTSLVPPFFKRGMHDNT